MTKKAEVFPCWSSPGRIKELEAALLGCLKNSDALELEFHEPSRAENFLSQAELDVLEKRAESELDSLKNDF